MKYSATINLDSTTDVKNFVNLVIKYSCDVDLISGRYVVDAKSILGVFSLDLTKPIVVEAEGEDAESLIAALAPYIVEA